MIGKNHSISLIILCGVLIGAINSSYSQELNHSHKNLGTQLADVVKDTVSLHENTWLGNGLLPLKPYDIWKEKVYNKTGVNYIIYLTPQFQFAPKTGDTQINWELDFMGQWDAIRTTKTKGGLKWWGIWNQTFSKYPTSEFANRQNLTIQPNDGDTAPDKSSLSIGVLWWEMEFNDWIAFRAGQLFGQAQYAINEFVDNDRAGFMAGPLAGPQGLNWMEYPTGLGAQVSVWSELFLFSVGFTDAKANGQYLDFDSFVDGKFVYHTELTADPNIGTDKEGSYRILYSYTDKTGTGIENQAGHSIALSAMQNLNDQWGLFARYTKSFDRLPEIRTAFVAGAILSKPFGKTSDKIGLGYMYGEPTASSLRNEHGMEMYWRMQITQRLDLTPDFQIYFTPSKAISNNAIALLGVRARLAF